MILDFTNLQVKDVSAFCGGEYIPWNAFTWYISEFVELTAYSNWSCGLTVRGDRQERFMYAKIREFASSSYNLEEEIVKMVKDPEKLRHRLMLNPGFVVRFLFERYRQQDEVSLLYDYVSMDRRQKSESNYRLIGKALASGLFDAERLMNGELGMSYSADRFDDIEVDLTQWAELAEKVGRIQPVNNCPIIPRGRIRYINDGGVVTRDLIFTTNSERDLVDIVKIRHIGPYSIMESSLSLSLTDDYRGSRIVRYQHTALILEYNENELVADYEKLMIYANDRALAGALQRTGAGNLVGKGIKIGRVSERVCSVRGYYRVRKGKLQYVRPYIRGAGDFKTKTINALED